MFGGGYVRRRLRSAAATFGGGYVRPIRILIRIRMRMRIWIRIWIRIWMSSTYILF